MVALKTWWASWQQQWRQRAAMEVVEDSVALRVAVQMLVVVGIVATDVASRQQESLPMSVWAVPLSIVGASWSWRQRHQRNVAIKFLLAIAMLVCLGDFFRDLLRSLNDTRLVLAELLVQLQVLHSFDLPRRRDLGYSIVIGLILIAVGGTLSQTWVYGVFLLLFLAVAFPTMVLDYRSRLGIYQAPFRQSAHSPPAARPSLKMPRVWSPRLAALLTPKRLFVIFGATVALGLAIFAVTPRFPGYQFQTLPVSNPIDIPANFDASRIVNPAYEDNRRQQEEGNAGGSGPGGFGRGTLSEPGQVDEEFYYGFNERINQNLRGNMEPKVVMRVRSQMEGFWRVLGFDRYTGAGWEISRNEQTVKLNRSSFSYKFDIPQMGSSARTKEIIQTYTILARLPNLIPAMAQPESIYFPTRKLNVGPEGGLRAPVNLVDGITYSVVSEVSYRDRERLQNAPTTYNEEIQKHYLQIPDAIREPVGKKAESLLNQAKTPITAPYEKAFFLAQALKQTYTVKEVPFLDRNQDLVEAFLFDWEGGYPDHFSTTLTVMLRSIGIPARLVVGFAAGEFNPFTGMYVVRNTDAYAMTEVYIPQYGWYSFDPIPGHETIPPSLEDEYAWSTLRTFWQWVAGWLPTPVRSALQAVLVAIAQGIASSIRWFINLFFQGWQGWFQGIIVAIAVAFVGWSGWQGWRQWRYRRWLRRLPPTERIYRETLATLSAQGYPRYPAQTPLEYARQYRMGAATPAGSIVEEISQAYVRWRYGNEAVDVAYLNRRLQQLQKMLASHKPSWWRWLVRWWRS
ncbi:DUF3488 and DUF4129 domain-containing transglutaminase family protein [Geitlerinema sp. PCC 9228]|uniref:transglutaminase TgpA family protein n=1 Tax=Geitlerinema sp. PCC 9228 TaxID=111611 RepID=UPI0008F9D135|nr:DUF3488 and DUF4129 domain-containing transglutaminase family protein [Geitlerinema sp. PCC 9228]